MISLSHVYSQNLAAPEQNVLNGEHFVVFIFSKQNKA